MEMNNGLRETLGKMSTEQLDGMLQAELQKRPPDKAAVMLIMGVLKEREAGDPIEIGPELHEAWAEFSSHCETHRERKSNVALLRVASMLLILGLLLFTLPQEAGAKSLWDRFLHVTDSIFEFFNPEDRNDHCVEYKFETDNPGLQQVYEAVVELGITDPVVPMWLPEGYELVELEKTTTRTKTKIHASFEWLGHVLIYKIEMYEINITHKYYKDASIFKVKEYGGFTHNVLQNNDMLVAIWTRDNVECFLTIDCQEDTLYEILKSIYVMEDET